MKLFYGWVIVGAAMVVTRVGFGAMFSLGVFLQPMSEAEGWPRAGISTAALLDFLAMGVGSFFYLVARELSHFYGAVAIAFTFRPPRLLPAALPTPSVAH